MICFTEQVILSLVNQKCDHSAIIAKKFMPVDAYKDVANIFDLTHGEVDPKLYVSKASQILNVKGRELN